ncbi:MAG: DUF411 domain-containing protein [Alphaproteobacteria bacterium]|nr:DUF411 domain-containing protein [Alphaproteobacteria bacterium]
MKSLNIFPVAALVAGLGFAGPAVSAQNNEMTVYKNPWCGCCTAWAGAMREAGYTVELVDLDDLSEVKKQASVTDELAGCHTVIFGEYILEGHVPLQAIDLLLAERPDIRGIATPGMPAGALGMGYDENAEYTVFAFFADTELAPTVFYQAGG